MKTMTREDKKLLLKDLCARLPYSVKCEIDDIDEPLELESIKFKGDYFIFGNGVYERYITEIKPYLRPMSSMTEEEKEDYSMYCENANGIEYLLENHFDYRELIPKGLAIEVTEDNNPYK